MKKYVRNPLLIVICYDLLMIFIFVTTVGLDTVFELLPFFISFEILRFYLPFLMLFLNYKFHDKRYQINVSSKKIIIVKDNRQISFQDVTMVEKFVSLTKYNPRRALMWDQFHYYKLKTYCGDEIFISCLVCDKLGMYFHRDKFTQNKEFLPYYERK